MGDYLEPPIRRTSNSPFNFPQTSFRSGSWPRLPRAETESSALKHFLCLVTMCRGISTNPLSCHGFRSSTREKTAWDIPGPHPHPPCLICLAPRSALESKIHFSSLFSLLEIRIILV